MGPWPIPHGTLAYPHGTLANPAWDPGQSRMGLGQPSRPIRMGRWVLLSATLQQAIQR